MPELGHLRTFVTVAEERNFTRAARRLHLAQQAVSKSVATLEAQLGVALLRRTTREVTLTPAGQTLFDAGRLALEQVDAAFARAAAHGRGQAGTVRVAVTPGVGTALHPRLTAALTQDAPDLQVAFQELRAVQATELLERRDLDLVVTRAPLTGDFGRAALTSSPATILVAPGHPLAGRTSITPPDLNGSQLQMWAGPGDPYTDDILRRLSDRGADLEVVVSQVTGGSGPPSLSGNRIAIRPAGWPSDGTVALPFDPPGLDLPLWVYWTFGTVDPIVARLREAFAA